VFIKLFVSFRPTIAQPGERRLDLSQQFALSVMGPVLAKTLTCINKRRRLMCEDDGMKMTVELATPDAFGAAASETKTAAFASKRLNREWKTMEVMIKIHCRDHHGATASLCTECQGLLDYANVRLERCRFGAEKPTCARCPVHCYQRARRKQVKVVMRYAGPRMLWEHPVMSLRHWLDGFRKAPAG
jgi:hypothetical protein